MKTYRTKSGPFTERPFYTLEDVERICTDELRKVDLFPLDPTPVRIERFIEKRFKIHPSYEDLPEGVLGYTEFGLEGVRGMAVSRSLAEESSKVLERRVNTTLAHEAGHGLLHAHLFVLGQQPRSLFGEGMDSNKPRILCRNGGIQGIRGYKETGYGGKWWELQANLAIGALLLPRTLVKIVLEPLMEKKGLLGSEILDRTRREEAMQILTQVFDVNPIAAKIRIETLFPRTQDYQLTL
jgi:hypothetical protein